MNLLRYHVTEARGSYSVQRAYDYSGGSVFSDHYHCDAVARRRRTFSVLSVRP